MKKIICLLFLLNATINIAQIKGKITDAQNQPIPAVSIHVENTYVGTISNDMGAYELNYNSKESFVIVYQCLGYKTAKITLKPDDSRNNVNVQLQEENYQLNTVVIDPKNNPANQIIRLAIKNKKDNSESAGAFNADFYSRGIFRIKDAPKKILGQKLDSFDEILDSTRSGVLYLSETVSKISYKKPDKLKETIIASKVSGNDKGFSFNSAASANFDLYENYIDLGTKAISPIADNAFNYYKYKIESSFFDQNNVQINKIKVTPKRNSEPVFEGYLYIVEDSWAIYACELTTNGKQVQMPIMNSMTIKQNFSYNQANKIWSKNAQTLDFSAGFMGININGRFTYVYTNYEFEPKFTRKTFSGPVLSFAAESNKKDDTYWNQFRPVPLTAEETNDYLKKDALQTKKKSKVYLDSIDAKSNRFKIDDVIGGYQYKNSFKKWRIEYEGLIKGVSFNTVQGWDLSTSLGYFKSDPDKRTQSNIKAEMDYGLAEKKFRGFVNYYNKFENIHHSELVLCGGRQALQFNGNKPINKVVNTVSTLFFEDNYMKLYESNFVGGIFNREWFNGFWLKTELYYSERKPLFNHTDYVTLNVADKNYTSNNPLAPELENSAAIVKHNLVKIRLGAKFNFGQEYWLRPDGKFNLSNDLYPTLQINFEKGLAGNESQYNYDHLSAQITYNRTLGNKGNLSMRANAGKFYRADNISFVDYKHFNGNRTYVGTEEQYLNRFNLLTYYIASTNDAYFEFHAEHNDNGYITNKLPLINLLHSTLVLGYHNLSVPERSPYHEYTVGLDQLGFGKFKIFRLDYIHSYQSGHQEDGVIFGLKILDAFN
ncbi:MAG: carboxypeptidase-like regulatory domain-containing protein [Bacteroidetes bacterium]|nr:carboxypeptidase-like regulatory domain-containing protein [Bacteroidota bacterium]